MLQNTKRLLFLRTEKQMMIEVVWSVDSLTAVRGGMAVVASVLLYLTINLWIG